MPQTYRLFQPAITTVVVYVLLIFVLPANRISMHTYHLNGLEYRALLFAVSLPSIATWVAAFLGYLKLLQYIRVINKSPEGADFATLARGYAWLAWSLPVAATINLLLTSAVNTWPHTQPAAIIIRNYINIALPLIAFSIMGTATRALMSRLKISLSSASIRGIMLVFLTGGVLYCFLTFQQLNLNSLHSTHNPYYMPLWLMVLTIIIPSLYAWFNGLLAAYEIMLYSRHTDGVLYRSALRLLVAGLVIIIVSFVAIQFTSSVNPGLARLILNWRLILTLLFRITSAVGFILVAVGAHRLKTIEEI